MRRRRRQRKSRAEAVPWYERFNIAAALADMEGWTGKKQQLSDFVPEKSKP